MIPYTQNMHVEWKIVTIITGYEKIKRICKNVLRMQHQPEADA